MSSDSSVSKLHRVNRTIHELCRDRGYAITDQEIQMDLATFENEFCSGGSPDRTKLNFFAEKRDENNNIVDQVYVFFSPEASVGVKTMRQFINILDEKRIHRGIMIYATNVTPSANKTISGMSEFSIEVFLESELLVNITHHMLVPQHIVLSTEEKKTLLEKYRLKDNQLPRILLGDPVARYYGLKRGQVVKIIRPSETAGRYASYRIAV